MKQCSRVGIPVEQPFTYIWLLVQPKHNWLSFQFLKRNQELFGLECLSSPRRRLPIFWYLQVTDRWRWEFRTAITPLDFSDLDEMLLENIINTIKTLALSSSWTPITNSISFKRPWNWLLTTNQFLSAIMKQTFSAFFGILCIQNCTLR